MKANGHGYLLNKRIYDNHVGVVHHYISLGLIRKIMYIPLNKFIFQTWFLFEFKKSFQLLNYKKYQKTKIKL
jgi:hypothetical protein